MKVLLNENFKKLEPNYLFSEISRRVELFRTQNPHKKIISLGIGDVSLPLSSSVAAEMSRAASSLGTREGFVGYGDTQGLCALREAIANKYKFRGISLTTDEIFISDGAKSDLSNISDVLGDNEVLICDPVYPVYLDTSIIAGRRIRFLEANEENNFLPSPKNLKRIPFVIYLCSPNNPTGAVFTKTQLGAWVDFANESGSLIIFDAAYESYIKSPSLPHSIFEIEGAKKCAIEVCSFSKSAGFTGIRCGWTAIPRELKIHALWKRRQNTKFNGASYISQRGALASLLPDGTAENSQNITYYMENAKKIASFLKEKGIYYIGGENAPYLWLKIPNGMTSWEFFDYLLKKSAVIGTPGVGFGKAGEGFFRFSSFTLREDVDEALARIAKII